MLRQETQKLKEEVSFLTKKCEEFLLDKNDDALLAVFKRKINELENQLDDMESEHDTRIARLKKKFNEAQQENLELQKRIRDLTSKESSNTEQEMAIGYEMRIREYERTLREKNLDLKKAVEQRSAWENRYRRLKEKTIRYFKDKKNRENSRDLKDFLGSSSGSFKMASGFKLKSAIRARPNSRRKSISLESNYSSGSNITDLKSNEHEKNNNKYRAVVKEKKRLEKICKDLTNKFMEYQKEAEADKLEALTKEKRRNEHQIAYLTNELDQIKNVKDSNEKKLLNKIRLLEKKLEEREQQMGILGNGIESLNRELKMKDDPSKNAIEVVAYLEKFAK